MTQALSLLVIAVLGLAVVPGSAQSQCLPIDQARTTVRAGQVIPLVKAVNAARAAAAGEVIDSRLCGSPGNYRYVITLLGQDGKVMRVSIDAQSGAVLGMK